jgi:hypothetical protein
MKILCKLESSATSNLNIDGVDLKNLSSKVAGLQSNPVNNVLFICLLLLYFFGK